MQTLSHPLMSQELRRRLEKSGTLSPGPGIHADCTLTCSLFNIPMGQTRFFSFFLIAALFLRAEALRGIQRILSGDSDTAQIVILQQPVPPNLDTLDLLPLTFTHHLC